MKKRLLISLGCSWTEGVGCYDYDILPDTFFDSNFYNTYPSKKIKILEKKLKDRYHEFGWPNRVGKKLGFDKVINLGRGASSNSGHIKTFLEFLDENDVSQYEVLVLWMMTDSSRFSFYVGNEVQDFLNSHTIDFPIYKEYVKQVASEYDYLLEQIFYMKVLENICENKGFDLLMTSWSPTIEDIPKTYKSKYLLENGNYFLNIPDKSYFSPCFHPNEIGYEWMANKLVEVIKKNHSKWYNQNPPIEMDWEWKGLPKFHRESKTLL